jgi:hypothetical protein
LDVQSSQRTKSRRHTPTRFGRVSFPPTNVTTLFLFFFSMSNKCNYFTFLYSEQRSDAHMLYSLSSTDSFLYIFPSRISDLTCNYLSGSIPPGWGSSKQLVKMYSLSHIYIIHSFFKCFLESILWWRMILT